MEIIIAIGLTAALGVLVGICYGDERFKEGFKRGAAKEREVAEKDYDAGYSDGYKAGIKIGKKTALVEEDLTKVVTFNDTVIFEARDGVRYGEEFGTTYTKEDLLKLKAEKVRQQVLEKAAEAVDVVVCGYNPRTMITEVAARLVVQRKG